MTIMQDNSTSEFKVLGMSMPTISVFYGIFLIGWGVVISLISGSSSLTSYIPSFLGVPLFIFSYLAIKFPTKKKLFMHIVVIFGLVIFLGGLDFIRTLAGGAAFENIWADASKIMMLFTGLFFTLQCVRSFIFARRNR